jgi:hypothetical protein
MHQLAVPDPSAVAEVVAELAAGRDVGMVGPPSCPEQDYGPSRGRTRVFGELVQRAGRQGRAGAPDHRGTRPD